MRQAVEMAHDQRTVIIVLHDLNAAAVHADRLVLMSSGAVVAQGRPREVLEADLLSTVYDQPMVVVDHPFRDCPLVLTSDAPPRA
jgi:iron complex transport system ATP-binding protein